MADLDLLDTLRNVFNYSTGNMLEQWNLNQMGWMVRLSKVRNEMDHEYQRQSLEQLITQQNVVPQSDAVVFSEHHALWQKLGFSQMQVSLWLASLPQNNYLKEPTAAPYQVTPDLAAHLLPLLQQAGGRMPLSQVLKKLPAGITTSEQQIRKLAQKHAQIEIKGPLLVLIN